MNASLCYIEEGGKPIETQLKKTSTNENNYWVHISKNQTGGSWRKIIQAAIIGQQTNSIATFCHLKIRNLSTIGVENTLARKETICYCQKEIRSLYDTDLVIALILKS